MKNDKIFILGLGHQKCGTTWLYEYLSQNSNFNGGFTKEYHIWDALDIPFLKSNRISLRRAIQQSAVQKRRFAMQTLNPYYFYYFNSLFSETVSVTADITPSYSGLGERRLAYIKERFSRLGVSVKAVILIREPVSRIKSAVKFNLSRKEYNEGINHGETNFDRALMQYYKSPHCTIRTQYQNIIRAAHNVLGEDNIYVGVYETMFEPDNIIRLSNFCGVEPYVNYASIYVNKTISSEDNYNGIDKEIKLYYQDTYDFCIDRLPELERLWN
jgi:hypothetical protein